jgi:hypothetical protein
VIGIDEVFDAEHGAGAISLSAAKSSRLSSRRSGAASMTSPASRARRARPPPATSPGSRSRRPLARQRSRPSAILLHAALARLGDGVVEQRARARRGRELRDPGAHGPGADDADDVWHPAHTAGS